MIPHPYNKKAKVKKLFALTAKALGELHVVNGAKSFFNPETNTIHIGKKPNLIKVISQNYDWPYRLPYHELGHAIFEAFYDRFDRSAYKKVFGDTISSPYPDGIEYTWRTVKNVFHADRHSVSRYGRICAEEAYAEAMSFVLADVDQSNEEVRTLVQLSYCEWVVNNVLNKRSRWGKYPGLTIEIQCSECLGWNEIEGVETFIYDHFCSECEEQLAT